MKFREKLEEILDKNIDQEIDKDILLSDYGKTINQIITLIKKDVIGKDEIEDKYCECEHCQLGINDYRTEGRNNFRHEQIKIIEEGL